MMVDPVSLIGLSLTCFHGCVKALVIIGKARSYTQDVADVQFRTELILHSLTTWAQQAGLTQNPPLLLVNTNDAPLVPEILKKLENLFTDINELKLRYGVDLQQTDEEVESIGEGPGEATNGQADVQRRSWTERIDVAVYLKRKQPWKRLRWVALDDEKFERLLIKAKGYVSHLGKFLEQARRARMDSQLELWLRNTVLNAEGRQLNILERVYHEPESSLAISAAARLKQSRLSLGVSDFLPDMSFSSLTTPKHLRRTSTSSFDTVETLNSGRLQETRLSMRLLTLSRAARALPLRTLAQYDDRTVLLEWKYVTDLDDPIISERVSQVAALLHDMGPTLHSLQCKGFVKDHVSKRYGYIFNLPDEFNSSSRPSSRATESSTPRSQAVPTQLKTLRQMLDEAPRPSLNIRLSMAVTLLETLLNLHTSGWLHKEFRSENIILIRRIEGTHVDEEHELTSYSMYIAGYVYSRLDSPGELTEPLQSELEADLYRHPDLLSDTRQPYRKAFDIFSVGCTLLEIGLWTNLRSVLEQHSNLRLQAQSPKITDATKSGRKPVPSTILQRGDSKAPLSSGSTKQLDALALRRELLQSDPSGQYDQPGEAANVSPSPKKTVRSEIIASLESITGKRFTGVVEKLLATGNATEDEFARNFTNEHESALDLEMMARDVVRAVADAV